MNSFSESLDWWKFRIAQNRGPSKHSEYRDDDEGNTDDDDDDDDDDELWWWKWSYEQWITLRELWENLKVAKSRWV